VFLLGYKTSGSGPNLESKNHSNQFTLRLTCLFVIFIVTLDRSFFFQRVALMENARNKRVYIY